MGSQPSHSVVADNGCDGLLKYRFQFIAMFITDFAHCSYQNNSCEMAIAIEISVRHQQVLSKLGKEASDVDTQRYRLVSSNTPVC
ncbi:hypothetical protein O9992_26500 [Vibrio lentus]|nr:hypothetical protein [Vibrio lentus]